MELENTIKQIIQSYSTKVNWQSNEMSLEHPKQNEETQYWTDEEDLAKETEWILKNKRTSKKRKATVSPVISPEHQNIEIKTLQGKKSYETNTKPSPINVINKQLSKP